MVCRACGHVYNDPIPTQEELAAFYATRYRIKYKGAAEPRARQIVRNFDRVERFYRIWWPLVRGCRRVLDVGSGSSEFLFFAHNLGLEARGIEPSRDYAAYSRDRLGLDVTTARLDDVDIGPGSFDFIRLNHVLEHLADPVGGLNNIRGWLAENGVLYVEVPNIEDYARGKSRGRIFHYGHISNFSPWTLRAAAGRAGLVEMPEVTSDLSGTTGTFFRRGPVWEDREAVNRANGQRVIRAIEAHYRGHRSLFDRTTRLAKKVATRVSEIRLGRNLGEPAAIGHYYLDRFRANGPGLPRQNPGAQIRL